MIYRSLIGYMSIYLSYCICHMLMNMSDLSFGLDTNSHNYGIYSRIRDAPLPYTIYISLISTILCGDNNPIDTTDKARGRETSKY